MCSYHLWASAAETRDPERAFPINAQSKGQDNLNNVKNANHRQLNESPFDLVRPPLIPVHPVHSCLGRPECAVHSSTSKP